MCCFGAPGGGADTGMGDSARADGQADRGAKPTADTGMGDSAPWNTTEVSRVWH
jgi:hypothetical protein